MSLLLDFTIELNSFDTSFIPAIIPVLSLKYEIPTQQCLRLNLMPDSRGNVIKTTK